VKKKVYGSIFYKVKRSDGFCAVGFYFIKNEHPKGFGALEDSPINKLRSSLRLWLCHCLTGRSGIIKQKNKSFSFPAVPLFGWVRWQKKE
jgi:hypothetical protein